MDVMAILVGGTEYVMTHISNDVWCFVTWRVFVVIHLLASCRISQLIGESPEVKQRGMQHHSLEPQQAQSEMTPDKNKSPGIMHAPIPAPSVDDMEPQSISFIGENFPAYNTACESTHGVSESHYGWHCVLCEVHAGAEETVEHCAYSTA
jgi:hypothetical protein